MLRLACTLSCAYLVSILFILLLVLWSFRWSLFWHLVHYLIAILAYSLFFTSVSHHRFESCCGRSTVTHAWRILTGCPDQYTIRLEDAGLYRIYNNMEHCRRGEEAGLANCYDDGFTGLWFSDWPQVRDKLTPCGHLSFVIVPLQALGH